MGLKSGSRDAGFDGDGSKSETEPERENPETVAESTTEEETVQPTSNESVTASESEPESQPETGSESDPSDRAAGGESQESAENASDRPSMQSIPYKLRRDKVNEGREQVPYFLREEIIEAEDELQSTLEEILGEDVYKSDYREAAMVVAQRNPELIADVLREWGYDLDLS